MTLMMKIGYFDINDDGASGTPFFEFFGEPQEVERYTLFFSRILHDFSEVDEIPENGEYCLKMLNIIEQIESSELNEKVVVGIYAFLFLYMNKEWVQVDLDDSPGWVDRPDSYFSLSVLKTGLQALIRFRNLPMHPDNTLEVVLY